jgi:Arc/MetJ family transcription regulator
MRTNIEIDDKLMRRAMTAAGTTTKRETVEKGLELLIRQRRQRGILRFKGKVDWRGNIDSWRRD